ncbi:hypothetical protein C0J52_09327 [Blattella germanica]|nr:hypothetical protein C0J52_09327 [Blattella germanica]
MASTKIILYINGVVVNISDRIKVAVKVRPLIEREKSEGISLQWKVKDNSIFKAGKKKEDSYTFVGNDATIKIFIHYCIAVEVESSFTECVLVILNNKENLKELSTASFVSTNL